MIAARKAAREALGPVLVIDDGDYSKGTARRGDARDQVGANFGNHEFDFGPDGLGTSIAVAAKAGRTPPIVAIDLSKDDLTLVDLQRLSQEGMLRRYLVIKRGGLRFCEPSNHTPSLLQDKVLRRPVETTGEGRTYTLEV